MSVVGYNGNTLIIKRDDTKIAAVRTKTVNQERANVDVTTDDSDGWMRHLPRPGTRGMNVEVAGIVTTGNESLFLGLGGDEFLDVDVENPDGSSYSAEDGFFLSNMSTTGAHDGSVEFTATLMSSGIVTRTPPPEPDP